VVRTIRTLHGAWWETAFGTLPGTRRPSVLIPRLPTTIRSESTSVAMSMMILAGSPARA
jgi:hypothetical protein